MTTYKAEADQSRAEDVISFRRDILFRTTAVVNYECGLHITPLQMYHAGFAHLYFAELPKMSPDSTRELVRVLADRVKLVIAREIYKQSTGKVLSVSK